MIVMEQKKQFLTPDEVAEILRISEDSVTRLLRQGKMPGYKIEGLWRIKQAEFDAYLTRQRNIPDKEQK